MTINVSGLEKHHLAELGRELLGAKGLSCVACHALKDRKSLGPPALRLTHAVERLQPEYFKELLLNPQATQLGTVMPPMLVGRKKGFLYREGEKQVEDNLTAATGTRKNFSSFEHSLRA